MQELLALYRQLVNETLPATYSFPVRFNHCFGRIVLDWLFQDCWYHHLSRKQAAYSQLSAAQLEKVIARMELWLKEQDVLIADNEASLRYRHKITSHSS